jgi:hypothetical protein
MVDRIVPAAIPDIATGVMVALLVVWYNFIRMHEWERKT